jgi:hypothetical protein
MGEETESQGSRSIFQVEKQVGKSKTGHVLWEEAYME